MVKWRPKRVHTFTKKRFLARKEKAGIRKESQRGTEKANSSQIWDKNDCLIEKMPEENGLKAKLNSGWNEKMLKIVIRTNLEKTKIQNDIGWAYPKKRTKNHIWLEIITSRYRKLNTLKYLTASIALQITLLDRIEVQSTQTFDKWERWGWMRFLAWLDFT